MQIESYLIEAHIFRENEKEIEFLLIKRAESEIYPGIWQMVSGKIDVNEKAFEAALREIKEETDLVPEEFWVVPNITSFYEPHRDSICMVPVFAAKVNMNSVVKISNEHSEYKWANLDEVKKLLAWPGQRESAQVIFDYFTKEKSYLKFVEIKIG